MSDYLQKEGNGGGSRVRSRALSILCMLSRTVGTVRGTDILFCTIVIASFNPSILSVNSFYCSTLWSSFNNLVGNPIYFVTCCVAPLFEGASVLKSLESFRVVQDSRVEWREDPRRHDQLRENPLSMCQSAKTKTVFTYLKALGWRNSEMLAMKCKTMTPRISKSAVCWWHRLTLNAMDANHVLRWCCMRPISSQHRCRWQWQ